MSPKLFSVSFIVLNLVPIYDARSSPFMFTKDDFTGLPSLPLFKRASENQRIADLPPNALVTVFFTMNTYSTTRVPPTPSGSGSPLKGKNLCIPLVHVFVIPPPSS